MAEEQSLEVLAPNAVEALNRSEIEAMIEVSKRYPRSLEQFKAKAMEGWNA